MQLVWFFFFISKTCMVFSWLKNKMLNNYAHMFHTPKVVGSHISVLKRLLKRSQVEKKEKGYTNKIYSIAYFINYQRESLMWLWTTQPISLSKQNTTKVNSHHKSPNTYPSIVFFLLPHLSKSISSHKTIPN